MTQFIIKDVNFVISTNKWLKINLKRNNIKVAIINIWNYMTQFIIIDVNFVIFTNTGLKIN